LYFNTFNINIFEKTPQKKIELMKEIFFKIIYFIVLDLLIDK